MTSHEIIPDSMNVLSLLYFFWSLNIILFIYNHDVQSPKAFDESGSTALHKASANGHLEVLKLLIQHGSDVELADMSGCTPLHLAARNGHLTCVKFLISQGADFRVKSKKGNTAMSMAKANCQPKVAEYLSNCGKLLIIVYSWTIRSTLCGLLGSCIFSWFKWKQTYCVIL